MNIVVSQSIKEVLQSLCDDGLVDSDKIGAGNFFWALPSKAGQTVFLLTQTHRETNSFKTLRRN